MILVERYEGETCEIDFIYDIPLMKLLLLIRQTQRGDDKCSHYMKRLLVYQQFVTHR